MEHYLTLLQQRIKKTPDQSVLTDYKGTVTYTYAEMAVKMAEVDALLTRLHIGAGDRVALCGRNSSNWAVAFYALMTSRRIAVSLLPDFTPEGVRDLINHAEAKLLFAGDLVWKNLVASTEAKDDEGAACLELLQAMPSLNGVIALADFHPFMLRSEADKEAFNIPTSQQTLDEILAQWQIGDLDELCLINYTSGTTSSPKGVMLSSRSISSNIEMVFRLVDDVEGETVVSILPLAHMYGLCIELIGVTILGAHVHYISRNPTPTVLAEALNAVHPVAMVCVPLVLEKVFRAKVLPIVNKPYMKMLMAVPGLNVLLGNKIRKTIIDAMGGRIRYYVIGGAAINQEVEYWMDRLKMPYIVGYGMTECGPLIAVSRVGTFAKGSCGKQVLNTELKIDSENPRAIDGEIMTRGANLMLGYYKNEEATRAAITEDGWLRTGDLGIINEAGDLFIRGRSKNMILGPSGQNIYPEELEDKVNSIAGVAESLVLEREGHLVALIYCDPLYARRLGKEKLEAAINKRLRHINHHLPLYSQIKSFEFVAEEFEKTPKRSIKRFLYK